MIFSRSCDLPMLHDNYSSVEALLGTEGLYVPRLNFKPFHVAISEGSHVAVGISSSGLLFVVISALSCRVSEPCRLSEFTLTGPQPSAIHWVS